MALKYIDSKTNCVLSKSIFLGRSLGATLALELATSYFPSGLLLDSVAPDLACAVKAKLKNNVFLAPLIHLPMESVLQFNPKISASLETLKEIDIVIFQGERDEIASFSQVTRAVNAYRNVDVIEVRGATHSNTHIIARDQYLARLSALFK